MTNDEKIIQLEPVAWGFQNTAITGSNRWMMLREKVPANDQYHGALWTPLYTSPSRRGWQDLTTAETKALWNATKKAGAFAALISAKLREKNT